MYNNNKRCTYKKHDVGSHYNHPSIDRTIQDHGLICIKILIRVHCSGHEWINGLDLNVGH